METYTAANTIVAIAFWSILFVGIFHRGIRYGFDRVMDHRRHVVDQRHERRMAQLDLDMVKRIADDEMRDAA